MYCPVCHCEYVAGIALCSDCQAALVQELPKESAAENKHLVLLWAGGDPRRHEELCALLESEQIPVETSLGGNLLGLTSALEIYVPSELAPKAKELLNETALLEEEWQQSAGGDAATQEEIEELAAEEAAGTRRNFPRAKHWYPEDATAQVWSGHDINLASMISASLRENMIPSRTDSAHDSTQSSPDAAKTLADARGIFVLPEDQSRAREIVRQIVDAVPP
jgi:hypothetical protein